LLGDVLAFAALDASTQILEREACIPLMQRLMTFDQASRQHRHLIVQAFDTEKIARIPKAINPTGEVFGSGGYRNI
jgi:hypothetical protein